MKKILLVLSFLLLGVIVACPDLLNADLNASATLREAFEKQPELVDAWASVIKHTELRGNVQFLENISGYSDDLLKKLDEDLLNPKYDLADVFKDSPDDVTNVWKKLKEDPSYSWEISKTDPVWQKWSQREFFKDVTALGKKFETETVLTTLKNRSSEWYGTLKCKISADYGKNLDDYDMFSQVQLKYDGDNYFVADQVFVKYDGFGDVEDIIVIENKLKNSTALTSPQNQALGKSSYTLWC